MSFTTASTADIILLSACSFLGNIGNAVTGFGQAIVYLFVWNIVELAGYNGDFKYAVFIQSLALFSVQPLAIYNAQVVKFGYRRILMLFIPITLISTPLGQLLSEKVPTKTVQAVAGVLVALVAVWEFYSKRGWFMSLCKNKKEGGSQSVLEVATNDSEVDNGENKKTDTDEFEDNIVIPSKLQVDESDLETANSSNRPSSRNSKTGDDGSNTRSERSVRFEDNVVIPSKLQVDESDPQAMNSSNHLSSQNDETGDDGLNTRSERSVRFEDNVVSTPKFQVDESDPDATNSRNHSSSQNNASSDYDGLSTGQNENKLFGLGRSGLLGLGRGALSLYSPFAISSNDLSDEFKIGPNKATCFTLLAGGASGFLGGMVAIRGPPLILYFFHPPKPVSFNKNTQRATATVITFFNVFMRQAFYFYNTFSDSGNIGYQKEDWRLYLSVIICSIAGQMVGNTIFAYLKDSKDTIRAILSVFLLMSGAGLLFSAFR